MEQFNIQEILNNWELKSAKNIKVWRKILANQMLRDFEHFLNKEVIEEFIQHELVHFKLNQLRKLENDN